MTKTPVVDAHHHFWDPTRRDYYWMGGDELASIRKPIGPEDLRPLLVQNKVDRTVIVQTIPSVEETQEFLSIAANTDFVAGVVGWVDLTDPAVGDILAELKDGENGKWLVGIRHQVHDEADPDWVARKDVIRGIKAVGAAGLAYDLLPKQAIIAGNVDRLFCFEKSECRTGCAASIADKLNAHFVEHLGWS